jgi:hypothetical protein
MYQMKHIMILSICLYLLLYGIIIIYRPSMVYMPDGTIRDFGVGYRNKTPTPLWLVSILLAVISYILVRYANLYIE